MLQPIKRLLQALTAVAFLGIMTLGASQALAATPTAVLACADDGVSFLGDCVTEEDCNRRCEEIAGEEAQGICAIVGGENCCWCLH